MIAIAGSKGGCGKTTTTLGLARAFARAETPALAIDADRQLPDLHVTACVDREPTLASLDGEDAGSIAQPIPEFPGVSVLPGPKPAESIDVQRTLEHVDSGDAQVLVDCPSGTGPDLTDPLTAADGVVIVTTDSGQSVKDARTTVDIADRLDVPVEGAVVTKCDSAPADVEDELGVPVLAAVPESESPLTDDAAVAAYDEAVRTLVAQDEPDPEDVDPAGTRMATGIDALDRALGGGLPPGSIAAVVADPAGQSEHLLHRLTATRGTLYLSTDRSERLVRDALAVDGGETGSPAVRVVDREAPLGDATDLLADLPDGANLIVDPADRLEATDREGYCSFLHTLEERMVETDSVAVLHCLESDQTPVGRDLTQRIADVIVSVAPVATDTGVEQRATITKFRPDPAVGGTASLTDSDTR